MATKPKPPVAKKAAAAKKTAKPSAAEAAAAAAKAAATRAKKYAEEARKAADEANAAAAGTNPEQRRDPVMPPWQNLVPEIKDGKVGVKVNGVWTDLEAWLQGAGSLRLVIGLQAAAGDSPAVRATMTQSLTEVLKFLEKNQRFLRFVAQCQSEQGNCPDSD